MAPYVIGGEKQGRVVGQWMNCIRVCVELIVVCVDACVVVREREGCYTVKIFYCGGRTWFTNRANSAGVERCSKLL